MNSKCSEGFGLLEKQLEGEGQFVIIVKLKSFSKILTEDRNINPENCRFESELLLLNQT